jgi:cytochrome P450
VPATRRLAPDGHLILVDLGGHPFGAGPRKCPGEAHARALAAGVVEGSR